MATLQAGSSKQWGLNKYQELEQAVHECRDRGLVHASLWAAEQLVGLPVDPLGPAQPLQRSDPSGSHHPKYLLARAYFDNKEYRRAAHVLAGVLGAKAFFLRCYSLYLAGEKRKEEERIERVGPLGKCDATNPELDGLEAELTAAHSQQRLDAWGLYLLGMVLSDREQKAQARQVLLASLTAFPCNWSAWQALQALCQDAETLNSLVLPPHWAAEFFYAAVSLELQRNAEGLSHLHNLSQAFPNSDFVVAQAAAAHYGLRNFQEAQDLYDDILQRDPYRVEGMDIYSNILYVKEQFAALSHLAHRCAMTDKYRPETCCVIGNYYSLKAHHEKAIEYFRRALKLNRNYLSAWTLMGHEYIEMKNASAAIEAYRRAVDLNSRDYRAWYGLGQAYEMLLMPYYALYYFRQAAALRPADARMWTAMGQCYQHEQLNMHEAALRCYHRALRNNDQEGIAIAKLARLYEYLGNSAEAARYHEANLKRLEEEGATGGQDAAEALLFLATHCKENGMLVDAEQYAMRLEGYGGQYHESAKSLLHELRSVKQAVGMPDPSAPPPAGLPFGPHTGGSSPPGMYLTPSNDAMDADGDGGDERPVTPPNQGIRPFGRGARGIGMGRRPPGLTATPSP